MQTRLSTTLKAAGISGYDASDPGTSSSLLLAARESAFAKTQAAQAQLQKKLDSQQRDMEKMGSDSYNRGPGANNGKGGSYRGPRAGNGKNKGNKGEQKGGKRSWDDRSDNRGYQTNNRRVIQRTGGR